MNDFKKRIIEPRSIFALLIINSPILIYSDFQVVEHLLAFMLIFVPIVSLILINENTIGGGDLKLFLALSLFLKLSMTVKMIFICFSTASVFSIFYFFVTKRKDIPLAPFIMIGFVFCFTKTYILK